jgi:hypothetical protein
LHADLRRRRERVAGGLDLVVEIERGALLEIVQALVAQARLVVGDPE